MLPMVVVAAAVVVVAMVAVVAVMVAVVAAAMAVVVAVAGVFLIRNGDEDIAAPEMHKVGRNERRRTF